jgi:peptide/nickel transport system permease protein
MLILVFAVQFGWLPSQGYGERNLKYLLLPTLTLAAPGLARLTRLSAVASSWHRAGTPAARC